MGIERGERSEGSLSEGKGRGERSGSRCTVGIGRGERSGWALSEGKGRGERVGRCCAEWTGLLFGAFCVEHDHFGEAVEGGASRTEPHVVG